VWWVLGAFIIASGLVLLTAIRRALRRGVQEVLEDHMLVLAGAFMAYYVFGALLIPFGPQDQAEYVLSYYRVGAPLAMRVTAVNNIGFGLAHFLAEISPHSSRLTVRRLVLIV
jgi:hypothetical protein